MSREGGAQYTLELGDTRSPRAIYIFASLGFPAGFLLRVERKLRQRGNGGCVDIERRWLCSCVILGLHLRTFCTRLNAAHSFIFFFFALFRQPPLSHTAENVKGLVCRKEREMLCQYNFLAWFSSQSAPRRVKFNFLDLENNFSDFQWRRNRFWFIYGMCPAFAIQITISRVLSVSSDKGNYLQPIFETFFYFFILSSRVAVIYFSHFVRVKYQWNHRIRFLALF